MFVRREAKVISTKSARTPVGYQSFAGAPYGAGWLLSTPAQVLGWTMPGGGVSNERRLYRAGGGLSDEKPVFIRREAK